MGAAPTAYRAGWLALAVVLLLGCHDTKDSGAPIDAAGGADPTVDLGFAPDSPQLDDSGLAGHWLARQIGDCIDEEEWLSFGNPGSIFTRTLINRNACMAPEDWTLLALDGTYSVSTDWQLVMDVDDGGFTERWSTTAALFADNQLSVEAFRSVDASGLVYERHYERMGNLDPSAYHETIDVTLTFDARPTESLEQCGLGVDLSAMLDSGADAMPEAFEATFELLCEVSWAPDSGVGTIVLRGLDGEDYGTYAREVLGFFTGHSDQLSNLIYRGLQPNLLAYDTAESLVSQWSLGTYQRSDEAPPASL